MRRKLNISHKHRFVLWSLPRMGTRYFGDVLRRFGMRTGAARPGQAPAPSHQIGYPAECRGYAVLLLLRNPYLRALSGWQWYNVVHRPTVHPRDFSAFIETLGHAGIAPVADVVGPWAGLVTHKIHLDRFREDFAQLPFMQGRNYRWPRNAYRSRYNRPAMDYYTPTLRQKVFKLYEKDFEYGGYDPEADFAFET